jgi:hypothetical protein
LAPPVVMNFGPGLWLVVLGGLLLLSAALGAGGA